MSIEFELERQAFLALNGGPHFKFSPAISLFVSCDSEKKVDRLWGKLVEGGMALMELGEYPFSRKFGWLQDKFGLSWQLNFDDREQVIAPCLLFVGEQHGHAANALEQYTTTLDDSTVVRVAHHGADGPEQEGTIQHAVLRLQGQEFMAIESRLDHKFTFTPAISFIVNCDNQGEVDRLWDALSDGGATEMCGWLRDRYGVSWQVVPASLFDMMRMGNARQTDSVMKALMQMTKLDQAKLEQAYDEA